MTCILLDHLLKALYCYYFCRKYLVTVQTQAGRVKLLDLDRYWFNPHMQIKRSPVWEVKSTSFSSEFGILSPAPSLLEGHLSPAGRHILLEFYVVFTFCLCISETGMSIARFFQ